MNNCGPDVLQEVEEENEFKFAGQYLKKVQYSFYLMADTNLQNNFKKVFTTLDNNLITDAVSKYLN